MPTTVASIKAVLTVDLSGLESGLSRADRELSEFAAKGRRYGSALSEALSRSLDGFTAAVNRSVRQAETEFARLSQTKLDVALDTASLARSVAAATVEVRSLETAGEQAALKMEQRFEQAFASLASVVGRTAGEIESQLARAAAPLPAAPPPGAGTPGAPPPPVPPPSGGGGGVPAPGGARTVAVTPQVDLKPLAAGYAQVDRMTVEAARRVTEEFQQGAHPQIAAEGIVRPLAALPAAGARAAAALSESFAGVRLAVDTSPVGRALGGLAGLAREALTRVSSEFRESRPRLEMNILPDLTQLPAHVRTLLQAVQAAFSATRLTLDSSPIGAALANVGNLARESAAGLVRAFQVRLPGLSLGGVTGSLTALPRAAAEAARAAGEQIAAGFARVRPAVNVAGVQQAFAGLAGAARGAMRGIVGQFTTPIPPLRVEAADASLQRLALSARKVGGQLYEALADGSATATRAAIANFRSLEAEIQKTIDLGTGTGGGGGGGGFGAFHALFVGGAISNFGREIERNITQPLVAADREAFNSAVRFDSLRRAMTAIMGSARAADVEIAKLTRAAESPGLGILEAQEGSIRLQAAGLSAETARRALEGFGKAISLAGGSKSDLREVSIQLQQMVSAGKVLTRDLRPILERAPSARGILQQVFGADFSSEKLEKAGVSVDEFLRVMIDGLERMTGIADSPRNALDNLQDAVLRLSAAVGKPFLEPFLAGGARLKGVIDGLRETFEHLSPPVQRFAAIFTTAAAVIAPIGPLLAGFGISLVAVGNFLKPAIAGILGIEAASVRLLPILGSLALGFTAITLVVAGFAAAYATNLGGLRDTTNRLFAPVVAYFISLGERLTGWWKQNLPLLQEVTRSVLAVLAQIWQASGSEILETARRAWGAVKGIIDAALDLLLGAVRLALQVLSGDWAGAWDTLVDTTGKVMGDLGRVVGDGATAAFHAFKAAWDFQHLFRDDAFRQGEESGRKLADAIVRGLHFADRAIGFTIQGWFDQIQYRLDHPGQLIEDARAFGEKIAAAFSPLHVTAPAPSLNLPKPEEDSRFWEMFDQRAKAAIASLGKVREAQAKIDLDARTALEKSQETYAKELAKVQRQLDELHAPNLAAKLHFELPGLTEAQYNVLAQRMLQLEAEKKAVEAVTRAAEELNRSLNDVAKRLLELAPQLPANLRKLVTGAAERAQEAAAAPVTLGKFPFQVPAGAIPASPAGGGPPVLPPATGVGTAAPAAGAAGSPRVNITEVMSQQFAIQSRAIQMEGTRFGERGCALAVSSILSGSVQALQGLREPSVSGLVRRLTGLGAQAVPIAQAQRGDVAVFPHHVGVMAEQGGQLGVVHNSTAAGRRVAFTPGYQQQASYALRLPGSGTAFGQQMGAVNAATKAANQSMLEQDRVLIAMAQEYLRVNKSIAEHRAVTTADRVALQYFGQSQVKVTDGMRQFAGELVERIQVEKLAVMLDKARDANNAARVSFLAASSATEVERAALEQTGKSFGSLTVDIRRNIAAGVEWNQQTKAVTAVKEITQQITLLGDVTDVERVSLETYQQSFTTLSEKVQAGVLRIVASRQALTATESYRQMRLEMEKLTATSSLQRAVLDSTGKTLQDLTTRAINAALAFTGLSKAQAQTPKTGWEAISEMTKGPGATRSQGRGVSSPWAEVTALTAPKGGDSGVLGSAKDLQRYRDELVKAALEVQRLQRSGAGEFAITGALKTFEAVLQTIPQPLIAADAMLTELAATFGKIRVAAQIGDSDEFKAWLREVRQGADDSRDALRGLREEQAQLAGSVRISALSQQVETTVFKTQSEALRALSPEMIRGGRDLQSLIDKHVMLAPAVETARRALLLNQTAFEKFGTTYAGAEAELAMAVQQLSEIDPSGVLVQSPAQVEAYKQQIDAIINRYQALAEVKRLAGGKFEAEQTGRATELDTRAMQAATQQLQEMVRGNAALHDAVALATGALTVHDAKVRELVPDYAALTAEQQAWVSAVADDDLVTAKIQEVAQAINGFMSSALDDLLNHGFKSFFASVISGFDNMLVQMAQKYLASQLTQLLMHGLNAAFGTDVFSTLAGAAPKAAVAAAGGGGGFVGDVVGSGIPFAAEGGPVTGGMPVWVGEKGIPEVFAPAAFVHDLGHRMVPKAARALGGPVAAGVPTWVGERGAPEVFAPGPFGGSVKLSRDAIRPPRTGRAGGGFVRFAEPVWVGEKGRPEIFVPPVSGHVYTLNQWVNRMTAPHARRALGGPVQAGEPVWVGDGGKAEVYMPRASEHVEAPAARGGGSGQKDGASAGGETTFNFHYKISTPDVGGFKRTQSQLISSAASQAEMVRRRGDR